MRRLFKLESNDIDTAKELFQLAYDMDNRGLYLAWQAYLLAIRASEGMASDREALREEIYALISKSLEMEPSNSIVLALASYIYLAIFDDNVLAGVHAERSVEINNANSFGHACLGLAQVFQGKGEEAYDRVNWGRTIAGLSPFRYKIETACSIIATVLGRIPDAIVHAEWARSYAPNYRPPLRYLIALYLQNGNLK